MESVPAPLSSVAEHPVPGAELQAPEVPALLLGKDNDRRLFLRGILALEHHPVTFEARGTEALADLAPATGNELLVLDLDPVEGPWSEQLAGALRLRPSLRVVVLLPPGSEAARTEAAAAGARVTLQRPFTLRAFRDAIGDVLAGSAPGGPQ
jgi:DNA-binding NarL/FixJ family response regulator